MSKDKQKKQKAAEKRKLREAERLKKAVEKQLAEASQKKTEDKEEPLPVKQKAEPSEKFIPGPQTEEDELWDSFEAFDLEGKVSLYLQSLKDGKLDNELAYEMLTEIRDGLDLHQRQDRERYDELVGILRQQAPNLYQADLPYYLRNLIDDAIPDKRWEIIPDLLAPFEEKPSLDLFSNIIDQLRYHGQGGLLIPVMKRMVPQIEKSGDYFEWAVQEFGSQLIRIILFGYLEKAKNPRAGDPALLEEASPFGGWKEGWLERFIPLLTESSPSAWQASDFGPDVDADQWEENITNLLAEFVTDRHQAGIPFGRADMAWAYITDALLYQLNAGPTRKKNGGKKAKQGQSSQRSSLIPTYDSLDQTFKGLFNFLLPRPYPFVATIELLPSYLHFLARLDLIHPEEMDDALNNLHQMSVIGLKMIERFGTDSLAVDNLRKSWAQETLEILRKDPALSEARSIPIREKHAERKAAQPPAGAFQTYTFQVTYLYSPQTQYRIEIRGNQTLADLHNAILNAADFDSDHYYSFFMSNKAWDTSTEYAGSPERHSRSASLIKISDLNLRMKQRFLYLYDYGDEHRFEVQLVSVNPNAPKGEYPRLIERHGENPSQYGDFDDDEDWEEDDEEA